VPEAAVTHEHPTTGPAVKKPPPWLVMSELLTNQVADCEISLKVLTPLELNSPWAKNWSLDVPRKTSAVVACVHAAPFDGCCAQIRITIRVIGVEVGTGAEVVELPPQLTSSVVITKTITGAITKHLFCHIKHPAMPWQLRRCQGGHRKNETNVAWSRSPRWREKTTAVKSPSTIRNRAGEPVRRPVRRKERRASREGGGSPMPACSRPAFAADIFRLPGGVKQPKRGAAMTANKSALK
jgi:hypothetical protein